LRDARVFSRSDQNLQELFIFVRM